jgi:hypothetical protein
MQVHEEDEPRLTVDHSPRRELQYERLDQLTIGILLGVRKEEYFPCWTESNSSRKPGNNFVRHLG